MSASLEVGQRVVLDGLPGIGGGRLKTIGVVHIVGPMDSVCWLPDVHRYWPIRAQDLRQGDLAVVPSGTWPIPGACPIFDRLFRTEHSSP